MEPLETIPMHLSELRHGNFLPTRKGAPSSGPSSATYWNTVVLQMYDVSTQSLPPSQVNCVPSERPRAVFNMHHLCKCIPWTPSACQDGDSQASLLSVQECLEQGFVERNRLKDAAVRVHVSNGPSSQVGAAGPEDVAGGSGW